MEKISWRSNDNLMIICSDDNLPLNKILKLHDLTIVVRHVFQDDNKYYPQFF